MASDWFSTTTQQNLYKYNADRSLLIVKQSMAVRMQQEMAKVEAKYDGKKAAGIEADITKLGEQKTDMAQWLSSMDSALKEFNTVREDLLQIKAALATSEPNPESFDLYYDALNSGLYNEKFDKTSLISNTNNHRGSWQENTTLVSGAGMEATLPHHYLGNDYAIQLDNGKLMEPNSKGNLTVGNATIARSNLVVVSRTDDHVEFQDVSDPNNPVTYTGTLKRGGLGVLPSWLYGDLSDPTVKQQAQDDLSAAFKKLARNELDFNNAQAALSGIDSSLTSKMRGLQDDYQKVANEEVDAKLAEKKAIKARFDLVNNTLALTSNNQSNFIKQMFNTKPPGKKDLTDALLGAVGAS